MHAASRLCAFIFVYYIAESSSEPHEVGITVLTFQVGGKKECKESEEYQKP